MKRTLAVFFLFALLALPAFAQDFEAADVHPAVPDATMSGGFLPGGRLEFRGQTLLQLISLAWTIPPAQIGGGPSWLDTDRFDVVAKAPAATGRPELLVMLQNLLAERFELSVKREDKPVPVYALVMGKGGPPKVSGENTDPGCKRSTEGGATLTCRHTTIDSLAETLQSAAPGYFTRPVVNRTDLKGAYDFELHWTARGRLPAGNEGLYHADSIFTSIEKQLGVKVEAQTAPQPVLTVLNAKRVPSPNPPDVTEKLGAPPTEFDVAEVRPSAPGEKPDFKEQNGRIEAKSIPLKELILFAYNVDEDALKGAPKWLDSALFDIVAKTAPTASADTLRTLLKALLAQRFGLKVHQDTEPLTVYALTAAKPKLKDAAPAGRTTCAFSQEDGKRSYTCTNMSMAQFTERLRTLAPEYLDHPVVDLTGLTGSYDFKVTWSPRARTLGRNGAPPAESAAPSGELTVFEAIDRQMGLKLATRKHPMPVIVIDQVNQKPTEN